MKILAAVMCHNTPETSDNIRQKLSPLIDVVVIDSGSSEDSRAKLADGVVYCENLFWTGCWKYAIELMEAASADVLWVIGGDVVLSSEAEDYIKSIESSLPFGCWHPVVDGASRPLMQASNNPKIPVSVWHLEGIAMAVSKEAVSAFNVIPTDNQYGWGLDIWMCWKSWTSSQRNVLDGRVTIHHPKLRGYSSDSAHREMIQWFLKHVGPDYRDKLHYWSDDADYNRIGYV